MKLRFFYLLILGILWGQSVWAQGFDDDDEVVPAQVVIADTAKLEINEELYGVRENVEMRGGLKYNIRISQLKPHTYVVMKFQKAGMKLETKRYLANEVGMIELEFMLTKIKVSGVAFIEYVSSSGKTVTLKSKIKVT